MLILEFEELGPMINKVYFYNQFWILNSQINWENVKILTEIRSAVQKIKFSIKDSFNKCGQKINFHCTFVL